MSTATELARAEAERAEAEQPDEELEQQEAEEQPDEQPVPVTAPEPTEPTEQMFQQVRRENGKHHERVRKIMGSFIDPFVECAHCGGSGLAMPAATAPALEHDPAAETCSVCKGFGQVETGSKREGYDVRNCANCNGQGWVGPENRNAVDAARAAVQSVGAGAPMSPVPVGSGGGPAPANEDPRAVALRELGYIIVAPPAG